MEKMNIYAKLMKVRVQFHKLDLKKSGENKFANFKYFELSDFLVEATELLEQNGLCTIVNFTEEQAILTVIDIDNPSETIQFTSPMKYAEIKGANAVQNLGGTQTYLTRYLYVQLLNVVENCTVDSAEPTNNKVTKTVRKNGAITEQEIDKLYKTAYSKGILINKVKQHIQSKFNKSIEELDKEEYKVALEGYLTMEKKEN